MSENHDEARSMSQVPIPVFWLGLLQDSKSEDASDSRVASMVTEISLRATWGRPASSRTWNDTSTSVLSW